MSKVIVGMYGSVIDSEGKHLGCAGAGKDTVANFMKERDEQWETYALAGPIKEIINRLFGWDISHSEGNLKEVELSVKLSCDWFIEAANLLEHKFGMYCDKINFDRDELLSRYCDAMGLKLGDRSITISPRRAYQLFGTEFGRSISPTIWLDLIPTEKPYLIITDVRFPNEVQWCEDQGVEMIKVTSKNTSRINGNTSHSSEQVCELRNAIVLQNFGTLEELKTSSEALSDYLFETVSGPGLQEGFSLDDLDNFQAEDVEADYQGLDL